MCDMVPSCQHFCSSCIQKYIALSYSYPACKLINIENTTHNTHSVNNNKGLEKYIIIKCSWVKINVIESKD